MSRFLPLTMCGRKSLGTRLTFVLDYKTVLIRRSSEIPEVGCYACSTEHSASDSLAMFLGFRKPFTAIQKECATPPHVQPMSRYITACDQFYQAFPTLVLQAINAGVRRLGYEASFSLHASLQCSDMCTDVEQGLPEYVYMHRKALFQLLVWGLQK